MNTTFARFVIRATISGYLPVFIGRRAFWHRLYDAAAQTVIRAHA